MTSYDEEIESKFQQDEQADERKKRLIVAFKNVLKTSDGRKVLKAILSMYPLVNETFSTDTSQMAFNCGRKSVILELYDFIKTNFGNDIFSAVDKEEI